MAAVNPYLNFPGNCDEAFGFYQSAFGVEPVSKMRFKEVPGDHAMGESNGEKIMHVALPIGSGNLLMGCDMPPGMGDVTIGNNVQISLHPESEEEAKRLFNALSEGGDVEVPLEKTFWAAAFGMFTDKFGIHWMVNYDDGKQQAGAA